MLGCRILFTTRERELGRFHSIEVSVLPEEPALQLLLGHPRRHAIRDDPRHPERPEAQAICRLLGWLPLALELAGAFLGENDDMPLADYRERLEREGCIPTIEGELEDLSRVNFQPTHDAAVGATLKSQWDLLKKPGDETARLVFQVAGQFGEAAGIPELTLGLLAGVSQSGSQGHRSPLQKSPEAAARRPSGRGAARRPRPAAPAGPRVRPGAHAAGRDRGVPARLRPPRRPGAGGLRRPGRARSGPAASTGWNDVLDDGRGVRRREATTASASVCSRGCRLFRREAHHLREWDAENDPSWFAQQVMFRAVSLGETSLAARAEQRLRELARPALLLRWRTLRESPALVRVLAGHQGSVKSVAVSPDGRRIVSGSDDQTVAVWDLETGTRLHALTGHQGAVTSVAVSPDGRRIVSGSEDKTVAVWDLETGTRLHALAGHQGWVNSVALSPDGRRIVSGSEDKTVAVWDLETGTRLHTLTGHQGRVNSVASSPDGRRIVSGSDDRTVAVWDLETGTRLHSLTGHQGWVRSVAMSPDGRRIVSGSYDNTVAVWDLGDRQPHSTRSPGIKAR